MNADRELRERTVRACLLVRKGSGDAPLNHQCGSPPHSAERDLHFRCATQSTSAAPPPHSAERALHFRCATQSTSAALPPHSAERALHFRCATQSTSAALPPHSAERALHFRCHSSHQCGSAAAQCGKAPPFRRLLFLLRLRLNWEA